MSRRRHANAVLLAAIGMVLPALAVASPIHQMTFTGIPADPNGTHTWVEDGITAHGTIASFTEPNAVHLDTDATSYSSGVSFTTGSLFNVSSLDVRAVGSSYCSATMESECWGPAPNFEGYFNDPYPYIWISGFENNALVSALGIYLPRSLVFETLFLGDDFAGIDRLVVSVRSFYDLGLPGFCNVGQPCAHIDVDNVTLESVPEPTAGILMGLGLAGLATRRRG